MNTVNENVLAAAGSQHKKFSRCTKFFTIGDNQLIDFAGRVQGSINLKKIKKIYELIGRKLYVEEWEFVHHNSAKVLKKFQKVKKRYHGNFDKLKKKKITSFEKLESFLISQNLKEKGIDSKFSLYWTKNDLIKKCR